MWEVQRTGYNWQRIQGTPSYILTYALAIDIPYQNFQNYFFFSFSKLNKVRVISRIMLSHELTAEVLTPQDSAFDWPYFCFGLFFYCKVKFWKCKNLKQIHNFNTLFACFLYNLLKEIRIETIWTGVRSLKLIQRDLS